MTRRLLLLALLALIARPGAGAPTPDVAKLHAIFDRAWETRLRENPLFATSAGRHEYNDRLPSATPADLERRNAQRKATLAELDAIDRAKLPPAEVVNYDMFRQGIVNAVASYELGDYQIPI